MKARTGCTILAAALAAALAVPAWTQEDRPETAEQAIKAADPDKVDPNDVKGERWTLQFKYSHPEAIVVRTPLGQRKVFWYLLYTVTNTSDEDRTFVPSFTLLTDTARVVKAGIHPQAFEAVKRKRKIKFLENTAQIHGTLRTGKDNARTGVAIFAPVDRKTDGFTVFVGGLSGEYVERPRPGVAEDAPPEKKVIRLRKTLALKYKLPGDEWWLNLDQPVFKSEAWTWR